MDEINVVVDDVAGLHKILVSLGFVVFARVKKHRASFLLDGVRYEFDTIDGCPTYLEVEASGVDVISVAVGKLGLSMDDAKAWTGGDVLRFYRAAPHYFQYRK